MERQRASRQLGTTTDSVVRVRGKEGNIHEKWERTLSSKRQNEEPPSERPTHPHPLAQEPRLSPRFGAWSLHELHCMWFQQKDLRFHKRLQTSTTGASELFSVPAPASNIPQMSHCLPRMIQNGKKIRKALDLIQFLFKLLGKFPLTQTAEEQVPGETAAASPWVVEGALGQAQFAKCSNSQKASQFSLAQISKEASLRSPLLPLTPPSIFHKLSCHSCFLENSNCPEIAEQLKGTLMAYIHLHYRHLKERTALLKIKAHAGNQEKGKQKPCYLSSLERERKGGGEKAQGTLLAHVQLGVHQDPQVLVCQAAFQTDSPQSVLVHGVSSPGHGIPPQVQDFALPLVELHEVPVSPFLQPVEFCIISKLAECAPCPIIQAIMKDAEQDWTQNRTELETSEALSIESEAGFISLAMHKEG
ncbi:hypothetical protein QYF61_026000 [Mycteria americana]|uniref:Uncharacterized protein n=1 Tax=Mycteria americana TaxID=33587 RepID=A0AAN7NPZ1_MYCAM|nr:hypothetical protein QYF61_026000 [Mycteria americana]